MYTFISKICAFSVTLVFLLSSCAEEIKTTFPSSLLVRQEGLLFADTSICVGQTIQVRLRLIAGSVEMNQLEIFENDQLISPDRINITGGSSWTGNNPVTLVNSDRNSAEYEITILPNPNIIQPTFRNFYFRVVDDLKQPDVAWIAADVAYPRPIFLDATDFISTDSTLFKGENLNVRLELNACWRDLTKLEILEDGVPLPSSQISIRLASDSSEVAVSNPLSIREQDRGGVTYDISIEPTDFTADSILRTYVFNLENSRTRFGIDDLPQSGTDTLNILYIEGAALTVNIESRVFLFNQAAGEGFGGLNLDTGESVDANVTLAIIQDEGNNPIDSISNIGDNWRRQISVVNSENTQLRVLPANSSIAFSSFEFTQQIASAFFRASVPNGDDSFAIDMVTDTVMDEKVTQPIEEGAIILVLSKGEYYALECLKIEALENNLLDSYEFAIKH